MSKFEFPASGLTIEHPITPEPLSQTIRLKLAAADAQELIKHVQKGGTAKLKAGKILAVEYGPRRLPLHKANDAHPQEIFARSNVSGDALQLASRVSHILELQHAREVLQKSEAAFNALKSQVDQAREEFSLHGSSTVNNKLLKPAHRPSPLAGALKSSRPSSPFLSAAFSPGLGPTSVPLLSGQNKEDKVKQDAMKIPLVHLLAMGPQDPVELVKKLRVKRAMLDPLLLRFAKDEAKGCKSLKDRQFRELDVWKFPYSSQGDRQKAIDNAISAFDRQRIDKTDKLWQMLLAKEDRGKGTYLSKLNFDKPLNPGNLTPRFNEKSTDGTSTGGKSMGSLGSGDSNNKAKTAVTKANDKTKPSIDKIVKNLTKGISVTKDAGKASGRSTPIPKDTIPKKPVATPKPDTKFKSAEKIIDSDEEVNAGPSVPRGKRPEIDGKSTKATLSSHKVAPGSNKTTLQRPSALTPSTSQRDIDRGRLAPSAAMVKTRGGKDTEPVRTSTAPPSRNASRLRTGSSPTKPSPLGSSPPTNDRAGDTSGTSSKGTPASSVASTPPASTDTSRGSQRTTTSVKPNDKITNGMKRKAEVHKDAPAAKKQQNQVNGNGIHHSRLPASLQVEVKNTVQKKSDSSSDDSALSRRPMTRERIVEEAKKFQKQYAKYKDLHEAADREQDPAKKDSMIDTVWDLHKRLEKIKSEIWRNWEEIEKNET